MSINLFNNCITELLKDKNLYEINIEHVYQYLESFKGLVYLLKNQTSLTINNLLIEISKQLQLKKISKNEILFQQGEVAENFYIILKGNLKVLKLIPYEYYMTNEEYISYLLNLRMNNQMEIIRQSRHYNNLIYPIPENFDFFVKNLSNQLAGGIYVDMHDIIEKAEEVNNYIFQEQLKDKKNMIKLSPKEYINKFKVSNEIINNTEIINNYINEKNDIINTKDISKIKLLMKDRKKVIIPSYEVFIQLSTGNTFEEQALENYGCLYQSSVISLEEGYLGYIDKKKYGLLVHESVEKKYKKIFSLLVYFSFFKLNNQFLFEKKYLNYINDRVFEVNHELFKEGDESENTYFVTEGEYELSMNKNIIEVNEMIIYYKKILKKLNNSNKVDKQIFDFEEENKQNNDLILNKKFRNDDANELLKKKRYIKINILYKKDILGLSDAFAYDKDHFESRKDLLIYTPFKKKCLLTCKCITSNCHAFYIPNSIFNNLYYNEGNYDIISKNLEFKKISSIIQRLKIYKKSVFDLVKKAQNKFSKKIKILKEISKIPKFNIYGLYKPKIYTKIIKELKESKESIDKNSERSQKPIITLKHNFNLNRFKENNELKNELFPSILKSQKSNKNISIKSNKRNTNNNIITNSNIYNKTYNSNFNNLFVHNILYENLFYNYTINIKKQSKHEQNYSFSKSLQSNKPLKGKERFHDNNIKKFCFTNYKIDSKKNNIDLKNINLSVNEKLMRNKKNIIGCYDPLAFDKFNNLFRFHFNRQINDTDVNKSNIDKL